MKKRIASNGEVVTTSENFITVSPSRVALFMVIVLLLFLLHVPLHIMRVMDIGGVSLWESSVCWDTK